MKKFHALSLSDVFIMLINVKMPTIVGILTFMSRIFSCSAELSMKKVFINSGPGWIQLILGSPLYTSIAHRLELPHVPEECLNS